MSYIEDKFYIQENVERRDLLEGLAEEASELAKAALKLIRASKLSGSVTPVEEIDATLKLSEEIGDVMMMIDALDIRALRSEYNPKWERWGNRIREEKMLRM